MKYIKYFIFILSILLVFIIFKYNKKDTFSYVSIGDNMSLYNEYLSDTYDFIYIEDLNKLVYDIKSNVVIGDKRIQNIIYNADIITISTLYNKLFNLEDLFVLLREYSDSTIIFTGYYDTSNSINNNINKLCSKYDIIFIDINILFKNNTKYLYQNYPFPNSDGYKLIASKIKTHFRV